MKFRNTRVRPLTALLSLFALVFCSFVGYGQVQMMEVPSVSQNLEPGAGTVMALPNDLGDGTVVFPFEIEDVDPLANDGDDPEVTCFLVQNLGTATSSDIIEIAVLDQDGNIVAGPKDDDGIGSVPPAGCPLGAPAGSNILWEAFFPVSETIPDFDPDNPESKIFAVAVRIADTSTLVDHSQNHTILLRVTIQFDEEIGSPQVPTTFTNSLTESVKDYAWNGGVNGFQALSFSPEPIRIGGDPGVVARFQICDADANTNELRLTELRLVQGPLGSAVIDDFEAFTLYKINGTPEQWGEVNSSDLGWGSSFNRGGSGIPLDVDPGFAIQDEECASFEIRASTAATAMKGRNVHLRITFKVEEPTFTAIDVSVAPSLQMSHIIMLGSGVLRIPDMQITGMNNLVPIEVVGFPQPGLGRIAVQTNSVQFDPNVIHVEAIEPVEPYQVDDFLADNRAGRFTFTLFIDPAQSDSAEVGIPEPSPVAFIKLSGQGHPGQRSILLFQTDLVEDSTGDDVTNDVLVVSGSVTLLTPGDVDMLDGIPTVSDMLLLANAIVSCPEEITGLSDEQKRIADVAPPQAEAGTIPTCNELTSADVAEIAELAITFGTPASTASLARPPSVPLPESPLTVQSIRVYPLADGTMWRLRLDGQGIASVQVIGFDLMGKKRFEAVAAGSKLAWATLDQSGRRLANGVYLYVVIVRGVAGEIWHSTIRKMAVLR
ncbi:MAG: hypothetical protein A2Z21_07620 [Candidatus Fraserbacteria bacterium RBG_16_55_9]|uniref:Cohesin domain-containing protein n=1 Tax=Fraserbacteria sp. (strain RBG_16_55_9) TaxID=1817864 RepID=A0A1F5V2V3_FRAXR|nr:MAG: hypothetical protein A2Z21_07620 [Candidatus Fraserbacteria bacterium RBG_16_55_9]